MQKNRKLLLVCGSLLVLLGATLPLQPQVLRKKNAPVAAEQPATAKKPNEEAKAEQPATTNKPTGGETAEPRARTRTRTDEVTIEEPRARTRTRTDDVIDRPTTPELETKTYEKPRSFGDRLDWCLRPGYQCGEFAARAFCRRNQFEDVKAFDAELVGRSERTRLFGTDEFCNGDHCTGFAYITCIAPIHHERVKQNPTWEGNRLDACLMQGGYCGGKQAADKFCASEGFGDALDFTLDPVPDRNKTRYIWGGLCERGCRGFQQIICNPRRW